MAIRVSAASRERILILLVIFIGDGFAFVPRATEEAELVCADFAFGAVFIDHAVAVVVDVIAHIGIRFFVFVVAREFGDIARAGTAVSSIAASGERGMYEFAIDAGHDADFSCGADTFVIVGDIAGAPAGLNELYALGFVFAAVCAFCAGAIDATVAVVVFVVAVFCGTGIDCRVGIIGILRIGLAERAFIDVFVGFGSHETVFIVVVAVIDLIFTDTTAFGGGEHDATAAFQAVICFGADERVLCFDISVFDGAADADGQKSRAN